MKKTYFTSNTNPFGLTDINLDRIKYENPSSRYLRYLIKKGKIVNQLNKGILLDVLYDGTQNMACCKFYDLESNEMKIWIDNTGHRSYCLSKASVESIKLHSKLMNYKGFTRFETIKKYDSLIDEEVDMIKLYGNSPTDIAGGKNNIKEILEGDVWEANIKYHHNYIYDIGLVPGLIYSIENGTIKKINYFKGTAMKTIIDEFLELFTNEKKELKEFASRNVDIFFMPIPNVSKLALDIEVDMDGNKRRFPDPKKAEQKIISISFASTNGLQIVYILECEKIENGDSHINFPEDVKIIFFKSEKKLLIESFRLMWKHPIIVSFNGDNFDLLYMYHRAINLKIDKDLNPIHVKRGYGLMSKYDCDLLHGIHVDLYPFFSNPAIKNYAFSGAYSKNSLDDISSSLLKKGKYQHEEEIHEMDYETLAWYNLKDSLLTLELIQYNNSLVWNLITLLCRISKLPIRDMIRRLISAWNKSLLYFEHRQRNYLIPRHDDLIVAKPGGFSKSTTGKLFQGAHVIKPVVGIHYDVVIMDFASLNPSIIKEFNLSYETIQCPHEDCKDNIIKGIPYYTCKHKMGIGAYIIGFFRDTRVKFFKPKSMDKSISKRWRDYYNTMQQALKVFINSAYGVFGSDRFSLFCLPVAESTTGIGRYSIKSTIKEAEDKGINVLYGDSDSVFLANTSPEQLRELEKWSKDELDLDLEEEKTYQFLALSNRKKNYVGIHKGGKNVDLKGVVAKKRNTPKFIKDVFMKLIEILKTVTNDGEFKEAREKIIKIVKTNRAKIGCQSAFALEDYAINTVLQKNIKKYEKTMPQHVRAAIELQNHTGRKFQKGDVVTYIKTKGESGAMALELAHIRNIDTKKYKELLKSALEQLLDALNISFEEINGIRKLEDFF